MASSTIPGETEAEKIEYIQEYFREVFTTEKGKAVLNILLTDLHYFDTLKNEEDMALNNYAKYMLNVRMGIKDTVAITDCLIKG